MANIELKDFIKQVRDEVIAAYEERSENPTFTLTEVSLEASFAVSSKGGAKWKLFVVDMEGELSAEKTHKVTLKLIPNGPPNDTMSKWHLNKANEGLNPNPGLPVGEYGKDDPYDPFR